MKAAGELGEKQKEQETAVNRLEQEDALKFVVVERRNLRRNCFHSAVVTSICQ